MSLAAQLLASPCSKGSPLPYTLERHAALCAAAGSAGHPAPLFVQVRTYGHTECGRIASNWTTPDGVHLWVVDLLGGGRAHATPRNVAQCSGLDGRCLCAGEGVQS